MKKVICCFSLLLVLVGCKNSSNHKCEMISVKGFEVPLITGKSINYETKDVVSTYIDALLYAKDNLTSYSGWTLVEQIFDMIKDDYDESGTIWAKCENSEFLYYIYVKAEGKYVLFDPEDHLSTKKWFNDDLIYYSYEQLEQGIKLINNNINKVTRKNCYMKFGDEANEIVFKSNTPLIMYYAYNVPLALGPQKISDEQMSELIKNENNDKVAATITTVADAVNYMMKKGYCADSGSDGAHFYKNMDYVDAGNLHYNDEWVMYTAPGLELLSIKGLQCSSSCTLMKYLLEGDYPEVGYIYTTNHAMLYIKADDDKYYLVQPSDYLNNRTFITWLEMYDDGDVFCTDSLKELMETYVDVRKGDGSVINTVFTYCYNGTICSGTLLTPTPDDELKKRYFPKGSNPVCWYGNVEVDEFIPKHDTSQDRIIGLTDLIYFE